GGGHFVATRDYRSDAALYDSGFGLDHEHPDHRRSGCRRGDPNRLFRVYPDSARDRALTDPPKILVAELRFVANYAKTNPVKTPVTRVFMVRHGATVLSAEDRFAGATDVALSDAGREQTRRLADRLSHEKILAVYASPMGRTVETAQILAGPHKLEVQARDGFREINHGRW